MGVLNFTGYDTGTSAEQYTPTGTFSIQNSVSHSGGYSLKVNPTTSALGYAGINGIDTTGSIGMSFGTNDLYTRFYFRVDTLPASGAEEIYTDFLFATSGPAFSIRINAAGSLDGYNSAGTKVGTGTTVLTTATWYRLEVHTQVGASGAYELKINGASEWSGTTNQTANTKDTIWMGKHVNRSSQTILCYFDDVCVRDDAYPGDGGSFLLVPGANGTYQNWSIGAGSGSHFQVVNDVPPDGNTSYLVSSGLNAETEQVKTRAQANITVTSVTSVKAVAYAARDAANGSVKVRVRSSSTDSDTAAAATTVSAYTFWGQILNTNPSGGGAWTAASLDTLQIGLNNLSANQTRLSAAYINFDGVFTPITFSAAVITANIGDGFTTC